MSVAVADDKGAPARIVYHNDGTTTMWLSDTLWIRVTALQAREWIALLAGIIDTAETLQCARQAQLVEAQRPIDCNALGGRVRPIGYARKIGGRR